MKSKCELVNTYEILEHVMGIGGLHPHRLDTIKDIRIKLVQHINSNAALAEGIVLDLGCGSGAGTFELATMLKGNQRVIGLDINAHAIESAKSIYANQKNLSFFHGDIKKFLIDNPDLKISGAICISVSMFLDDIKEFYHHLYCALNDGGIFIDAPFMFRNINTDLPEKFRRNTYAVCGCNMQMLNLDQIRTLLNSAGFSNVQCLEHDFDLMKLSVLFSDYSPRFLLSNFFRNVFSPPKYFGNISSRYIFTRTLKVFIFFLMNRHKYASGEFVAYKP